MSLSRPPCASSSLRSSSFVREQGKQRAETAEARSGRSPHRGSTPSSAEGVLTEAVQATKCIEESKGAIHCKKEKEKTVAKNTVNEATQRLTTSVRRRTRPLSRVQLRF